METTSLRSGFFDKKLKIIDEAFKLIFIIFVNLWSRNGFTGPNPMKTQ